MNDKTIINISTESHTDIDYAKVLMILAIIVSLAIASISIANEYDYWLVFVCGFNVGTWLIHLLNRE